MVKIRPTINSLFYSKKYKEVGTITRIVLIKNRIKIFVKFITGNRETFFVSTDQLMYNENSNIWHKIV
jgi:hypothetical protein